MRTLAFAAALLLGLPLAQAQGYPEKPITLIIPLGAGGSHDLNARVFTSVISNYLPQPMVVRLMPGAAGQTGTAAAVNAPSDGYTLIFSHNYIDQLQQHVEKLPYDPTKELETIVRLNYAPGAVVVRADKPWKTLKEMFDYGRENPGRLKFGHSGNWGAVMTPGAQLLAEAGVDATFVAHKGGGPAMQALIAGDVDFTLAFPSVIESQGDRLRVLAVTGDKSPFPGVPTVADLGYKSTGLEMSRIVLGPRDMPEERKRVLREAFRKLDKDKTYLRLMGKIGENTALMSGPEYEKIRARQKDAYRALVEKLTR